VRTHRPLTWLLIAALVSSWGTRAQERFSFFAASTPETAERMLRLAGLGDDDVVLDLGSGDGLIPLMAARMNARVRGVGVDINPTLVAQSNQRAREAGVGDRVVFRHQNAFDAEMGEATIITMWLFPELMRLLRPVILERARPGTRVVTSTWPLGTWKPDASSSGGMALFLWVVPARVEGGWEWMLDLGGARVPYSAVLEQQFQVVEGVVRAGDRREVLEPIALRGARLEFSLAITIDGLGLTRHQFRGTVQATDIVGDVEISPAGSAPFTLPWRASRTERPRYFAPTGTTLFATPSAGGS
jgi:SAM-dependent methyltransferase